ncbi:Universal stress protein [Streptomyces sp. enrichment culture]|uniref:universal stress protein n=1 Tax=Streptomyces sp. enrichment culture TaxID=1795815 RepID=UPI003F57E7D8
MERHVVAAVDGSRQSLAAAQWAAGEALRRGVPLRLVHAWTWDPRPAATVPMGTSRRAWAEETLRSAAGGVRAAHQGLDVTELLVKTDAVVDALVAAAAGAQVAVLGSRGLGPLAGFVLGSVSQRVVARSPRPVVLVRAGVTRSGEHLPAGDGISPEEIPGTPYRDVVLGLDTRRPCDELLAFAFDCARRRPGARLHVVHAYVAALRDLADGPADTLPAPAGVLAEQERALVAAVRPWCGKYPEVPVVETVAEGRAAAELVRASAGASLVVVGRRDHGTHRPGPHVGPVTHAVLHHVACPVAVVPHE